MRASRAGLKWLLNRGLTALVITSSEGISSPLRISVITSVARLLVRKSGLLFMTPNVSNRYGRNWNWLLPERRKRNLLVWGILAGALTGLVSHYLAWYLMFVGANICFWLSGGCTSSLGEPPASLQDGLWGAAALTMFSLVFVGWMTIMLGGAVGGVYAFLVRLQASRGEYPGEFNE